MAEAMRAGRSAGGSTARLQVAARASGSRARVHIERWLTELTARELGRAAHGSVPRIEADLCRSPNGWESAQAVRILASRSLVIAVVRRNGARARPMATIAAQPVIADQSMPTA